MSDCCCRQVPAKTSVNGTHLFDLIRVLALVRQCRVLNAEVPWCFCNVLRDVWVDVPASGQPTLVLSTVAGVITQTALALSAGTSKS